MTAPVQRIVAVATCLAAGVLALGWRAETTGAAPGVPKAIAAHRTPSQPNIAGSWDPRAAAAYLDQRETWWIAWPKAARDHETFCVSCHTAVPYALARPALRRALGVQAPTENERRLLENVVRRVRLWKEVAPFYTDADRGAYKTVESRGTESVLNALILASNDAPSGRLSSDSRAAFDHMWAEQQTTGSKQGAWLWLRFANEPWEADDSDYYGATLAAVAVGLAPGNYRASPEIQTNVQKVREYLNRERAAQTLMNRVALLWADAKLPGLLDADKRRAIVQEVLAMQRPDGGWSLSSLAAGWTRADGTPQETRSDGVATGMVVFALLQAGAPRENPQQQRALAWLAANQGKTQGSWPAYSLNRNEEHHQTPETARFMSDAATAYAVLALTEANQP